jgi:Sec1 family
LGIVERLLKFGSIAERRGQFSSEKGLLSRAKEVYKSYLKDAPSVYLQHQTYMKRLADEILAGSSDVSQVYPLQTGSRNIPPKDVMVFVVGGMTWEEMRDFGWANEKNKFSSPRYFLGSTSVINSKE